MKKLRQKAGRILTLVVTLCMMFTMTLPVMAEDETNNLVATDDPRESIMLMTLGYEDDNGVYQAYKGGTCFLINDEYVLTNKHVVTISSQDELNDLRKMSGVADLQASDSHIKLYLFVNRDMKVAATMHDSVNSDDMDFAAVKLAEKIYDRKPVALGDSDAVKTKEAVYAMGFPADSISTKNYNTKDDVSTVNGAVSKLTVTGNVDIIEHTAPLNLGNSGGPLLDENNNVVGLNTFIAGKKNYSIQINYIKKGLDTFGIPYVAGTPMNSTPELTQDTETTPDSEKEEEKPDNTAILTELQSALDDAKAVDTTKFTEETVKALDDSIGTAEAVLANDAAEAVEIQNATDDLNDAINALEEKSGPNMMLIIAIVAAVVIVIIIIIVVVMSSKKKKAAPVPVQGGPAPGPSNWDANSGNAYGSVDSFAKPSPMPQQDTIPEGAGETTLLDAGAGETTLLSNAGSAYLIRKKNGEKIAVNLQNFKLGKERKKVNYCISDNTSVSRVHCEIVKKGSDYYAIDQGATNFTFVNGVQLSPHKETLLSDQSVLKLSDEEFEFHLS
ncbi:MAG: trypsin-like peptidase domain-containing protein [Faecalicatena sp.]|uniref:trypsin-like peptidase domain-containing protein n=1 Tax=Faecalicatena sp. TaxID=2005360 RepID=UPI00258BB064|nr:trypsin-like peptidase domain-containing protein [Faecalicatena sp.]MCI6464637.1 trypsin-like peptidase domain-containing protein [Faecalicatena sp.]MDY5618214.1 trypsin-like peptidase domain-containing protein [Lachnospiraceae bacterium]